MTKKLNIAITGANGYIGSYFKNFLADKGHAIYTLGRAQVESAQFIYFDLAKPNISADLAHIDVLIHCAYDFSLTDFAKIHAVNIEGSIALFKQAHAAGVKKIINISSISSFVDAISNYGRAKYAIELAARQFDVITVRPGLVFNKNLGGIMGAINKVIKKFPAAPLIGKGDQIFFPCHLDDLAQLIEHLIQHDVNPSTPITGASENIITFKEMVKTMAALNQKKIMLVPLPFNLLFAGLKCAEILKINLGLRSDSLKYMKHYNQHPDFMPLRRTKILFRPFSCETLIE